MSVSDDPLKDVFENIHDGVFVLREDEAEVIYTNSSALDLLGYSESDVVGEPITKFVASEHADGIEEVLETYETEEDTEGYETEMVTNRGSVPVEVNMTGIEYAGNSAVMVSFREGAESRKELLRSKRAIEEAPVGITLTDTANEDGGRQLTYANKGFEEITGYSRDEILGRDCRFLQGDETDEETVTEIRHALENEETSTTQLLNYTKDGTHFWNELTITPIYDSGELTGFAGFQKDVTRQVEYRKALEKAKDRLAFLNRIVRHDIRNDMNLILGWSDMLKDHVDDEGDEYLEAASDACKHVVDLTKTARDFVEAVEEEEKTELTEIDLSETLESVITRRRQSYSDADFVLEEVPDVDVSANSLLSTVFRNLLNNAVQHNDSEETRVEVSAEEEDGYIVVSVADNGSGIPDERKEEIFGRGEKGLESKGTGIGLYLVDTLVDEYGGDVWVEDRQDDTEGSVFKVRLRTC